MRTTLNKIRAHRMLASILGVCCGGVVIVLMVLR